MFVLNETQNNDPGLFKTTPTGALKLGDKCLWSRMVRMEADYNFKKKEKKNQAALFAPTGTSTSTSFFNYSL